MENISFDQFLSVNMRLGEIIEVRDFPKAHRPAYQLLIDFGKDLGHKKSSAQLCANYSKEDLLGKRIVAVVNFPPKQIANFMSEVLVLGMTDTQGGILLLQLDNMEQIELGAQVH